MSSTYPKSEDEIQEAVNEAFKDFKNPYIGMSAEGARMFDNAVKDVVRKSICELLHKLTGKSMEGCKIILEFHNWDMIKAVKHLKLEKDGGEL